METKEVVRHLSESGCTYTLEEIQKIYHEAFRRGVECCRDVVANGGIPEKVVEYWYHYGAKK